MSIEQHAVDPKTQAAVAAKVQRHLHDHWKSYSFQGGLMIVVGILALFAPFAATLATTLFFGWLMIFGGIVGAISAFRAKGAPGFWSSVLLAVLAFILGVVIIINPIAGSVTLTWVLALYFLLSGVFNFSIANAVKISTRRSVWLVISGIIDIALAVFLVAGLPGTAVWAIGLFLGVSFITSGVALVSAALDARSRPPQRG